MGRRLLQIWMPQSLLTIGRSIASAALSVSTGRRKLTSIGERSIATSSKSTRLQPTQLPSTPSQPDSTLQLGMELWHHLAEGLWRIYSWIGKGPIMNQLKQLLMQMQQYLMGLPSLTLPRNVESVKRLNKKTMPGMLSYLEAYHQAF